MFVKSMFVKSCYAFVLCKQSVCLVNDKQWAGNALILKLMMHNQ